MNLTDIANDLIAIARPSTDPAECLLQFIDAPDAITPTNAKCFIYLTALDLSDSLADDLLETLDALIERDPH